jgi:peptidase E
VNSPINPIFLLADSQLLFWQRDGIPFLDTVRALVQNTRPQAAYIGASNGDNPDYYSIFEAAMETIGVKDCRMIPSALSPDDASFVDQADIILLAGGDVQRGWSSFESNGLNQTLMRRYYEGAVLMGVSAGAVQLGLCGWAEDEISPDKLFDTFRLVPYIISAHDEKNEWETLKCVVRLKGENARGIGLPTGGGIIYHADGSIEPVRYPAYEVSLSNENIESFLLFTPTITEDNEELPVF